MIFCGLVLSVPTFFWGWVLDLYISIVTQLDLRMQNLLLQYSPFKHFKSLKLHFVTLLLSWKLCMPSHLFYWNGWRVDKFSFPALFQFGQTHWFLCCKSSNLMVNFFSTSSLPSPWSSILQMYLGTIQNMSNKLGLSWAKLKFS